MDFGKIVPENQPAAKALDPKKPKKSQDLKINKKGGNFLE
jgi:hypothetical protein